MYAGILHAGTRHVIRAVEYVNGIVSHESHRGVYTLAPGCCNVRTRACLHYNRVYYNQATGCSTDYLGG